jgi:hypothetical protein
VSPTQARANSPARVTITLRLAACKWLIAAEAVDCPSTTTGTGSIPEGLLSHDNNAGPVAVLIGLDQSVGDKLRSSSPDISAAVEELVSALMTDDALTEASNSERRQFAKYLTIARIKLDNAIAVVRSGEARGTEVPAVVAPRAVASQAVAPEAVAAEAVAAEAVAGGGPRE